MPNLAIRLICSGAMAISWLSFAILFFHQFDTSGFFTFELTWPFRQLYGPLSIQDEETTTG
jgi:hypothetical protein